MLTGTKVDHVELWISPFPATLLDMHHEQLRKCRISTGSSGSARSTKSWMISVLCNETHSLILDRQTSNQRSHQSSISSRPPALLPTSRFCKCSKSTLEFLPKTYVETGDGGGQWAPVGTCRRPRCSCTHALNYVQDSPDRIGSRNIFLVCGSSAVGSNA